MSKRLLVLAGCVLLILVLCGVPFMAACAPEEEQVRELKIGLAYGMTGSFISFTIPLANMIMLQAERINDHGGVTVGGERYIITLIEADTKCTPEGGVSACERLMSLYDVKIIIGPCISAGSIAAVPLMMENKVLNTSPITSPKVLAPENHYYFKCQYPGSLVSRGYPAFLAERYPDIEKLAFVCADDDAGYAGVEESIAGVEELLEEQPGRMEIVFTDYYPKGSVDHTSILTAALASNPDVIYLGAAPPEEMSMIVKEARDLGYTGWFTAGASFTIERLNEIAGRDYAYNIIHNSFAIDDPPEPYVPPGQEERWEWFCDIFGDWAWLAEAYQTEYGEAMPGVLVYANDQLGTLIQGIMAADSLDNDKIVEALESMEYIPTYFGMGCWMGEETWGLNHQMWRPISLYEISYGEEIPVYPPVLPAFYP